MWKYSRFLDRLEDMMQWYTHENKGEDYKEDHNPWQYSNYTKDLNKMSTKELYKHWFTKNKQEAVNIEGYQKEKDSIVKQIQKMSGYQGLKVQEEDIEKYSDIYFRGFDSG